ncbi:cobalamin B12-binding domain-containing protein [Hydrogenophaga sp. T2]|uniref:cobalamin B12-binding domain-containing protein n=1 Tax=Hydrogenophaga sp. T2 TaxID=3132823 RepID=UPI003CFBB0B7
MIMLSTPEPAHAAPVAIGQGHASVLSQTLNRSIIPRLIEAHRPHPSAPPAEALSEPAITAFARLLLAPDPAPAFEHIEVQRRRGLSIESLYLDLVTPAARLLGEWWEVDECSFTDVTLGAGRLQHLLRDHSLSRDLALQPVGDGRRVLLAPAPREQHSLGLLMVAEFFRHAGWDVHGGPTEAGSDPVRSVGRHWYDLVGFSLAAEVHAEALQRTIAQVRSASRNPRIGILVGGAAFHARPTLHGALGADLALADAAQAPALALRFLQQLPR